MIPAQFWALNDIETLLKRQMGLAFCITKILIHFNTKQFIDSLLCDKSCDNFGIIGSYKALIFSIFNNYLFYEQIQYLQIGSKATFGLY